MVLKLVMVARRLKIIMKPPPIERKLKSILKLVMHDGGEEIKNDELADDTKEEENYSERCVKYLLKNVTMREGRCKCKYRTVRDRAYVAKASSDLTEGFREIQVSL